MLHALFNGIDVALRWTTLVAGAYRQTRVNTKVVGPWRIVDKPAKVQTVTYVSAGEHLWKASVAYRRPWKNSSYIGYLRVVRTCSWSFDIGRRLIGGVNDQGKDRSGSGTFGLTPGASPLSGTCLVIGNIRIEVGHLSPL
jgi:hypothetical protein